MKSIASFMAGLLVGGALVCTSLKYHVVRADNGFHLVPKVSASFAEAYVDIRDFSLSDWNQHRSLAVALVQAEKGDLLQDAATGGLRRTVDDAIEALSVPAAP